jgi:hypothetical protein
MTIRFRQVALAISCTVLFLALSGSGAAFAQFQPKMNLANDKAVDPTKEAKKKVIDEQYQSTLKAIPDKPQKVDPWGNIRSSTPSPK